MAKKVKKGTEVVYRIAAASFVRVGVLLDRTVTEDGCKAWLVQDHATGNLYQLVDGRARIRIPAEGEYLDGYIQHVRAAFKDGRLSILPDAVLTVSNGAKSRDMSGKELLAEGPSPAEPTGRKPKRYKLQPPPEFRPAPAPEPLLDGVTDMADETAKEIKRQLGGDE